MSAAEATWAAHAEHIRTAVLARAWSERRGAFVESPEVSTVETIGRTLRRGDYLLRYDEVDDFGHPASAFNVCTFWYIDALASIGRMAEARELFESMLARRNPLGLLSEDINPDNGEAWGNFPQTYSLVGLINAAVRLSRRWEDLV